MLWRSCPPRFTEVLTSSVEVVSKLSRRNSNGAVQFIQQCYGTDNIRVVSVDTTLLTQALSRYDSRADKDWRLTVCISFVVTQQQDLVDVLTSDRHFR